MQPPAFERIQLTDAIPRSLVQPVKLGDVLDEQQAISVRRYNLTITVRSLPGFDVPTPVTSRLS
jgi:hypothetical protein